jgi:hypothetical protein
MQIFQKKKKKPEIQSQVFHIRDSNLYVLHLETGSFRGWGMALVVEGYLAGQEVKPQYCHLKKKKIAHSFPFQNC